MAAGAVVHPRRRIPARQLWAGNPAAFVRDLSKAELAEAAAHAEDEADVAAEHAREFLPQSTVYAHAEKLGVEDAVSARRCARTAPASSPPPAHPRFAPPPPPPRSASAKSTRSRRRLRPSTSSELRVFLAALLFLLLSSFLSLK